MAKITKNHALFQSCLHYCEGKGYPIPVGGDSELMFTKEHDRDHALDCAWEDSMVAIEFQGGGRKGRHLRFNGYAQDCVKMAYALSMNWKMYYVTTQQATFGMHFLVMDYEFGGRDMTKMAAGLKEISQHFVSRRRSKDDVTLRAIFDKVCKPKRVRRRKKGTDD